MVGRLPVIVIVALSVLAGLWPCCYSSLVIIEVVGVSAVTDVSSTAG